VQGTGLSKPTVLEVLRQLLDYGLIARAGRTSGQVGPSAQLYEVSSASGVVIGIDVGYEWVRVPVVLGGSILAALPRRFVSRIEDGVHRLAPRARCTVCRDRPVVGAALAALALAGVDHAATLQVRAVLNDD
jgi:hypothetical protein